MLLKTSVQLQIITVTHDYVCCVIDDFLYGYYRYSSQVLAPFMHSYPTFTVQFYISQLILHFLLIQLPMIHVYLRNEFNAF